MLRTAQVKHTQPHTHTRHTHSGDLLRLWIKWSLDVPGPTGPQNSKTRSCLCSPSTAAWLFGRAFRATYCTAWVCSGVSTFAASSSLKGPNVPETQHKHKKAITHATSVSAFTYMSAPDAHLGADSSSPGSKACSWLGKGRCFAPWTHVHSKGNWVFGFPSKCF